MRLGFDCDGVLADFASDYQSLIIKVTGKDLFQPGDVENPPVWSWPEFRGYTKEDMTAVWKVIAEHHAFSLGHRETRDCSTLRMLMPDLQRNHDVYFITNRVGETAKWQTESWLQFHLGMLNPTVLISAEKGLCAKALELDCYIDDNLDNANDVAMKSPDTRVYLLNRRYNSDPTLAVRVDTLGQMFDLEIDHL